MIQLLLIETPVSGIKSFRSNSLEETLSMLYELEYKFSMITTKPFTGSLQRKDNILSIIIDTSKKVIEKVSEAFFDIYETWSSQHSVDNPRKWAEQRVKDSFRVLEDYSFEDDISYNAIIRAFERNPRLQDYMAQSVAAAFEGYGLTRFRNIEYFTDFISRVGRIYDDVFREIVKEAEQAIATELEYFIDSVKEMKDDEEDAAWAEDLDLEEFASRFPESAWPASAVYDAFVVVQEKIGLPEWYKRWKAKGIDRTIKRINEITKNLARIKTFSLQRQFGILNEAINATHQTGSMLEFFEYRHGVGEEFFYELSTRKTDDWDKELREIGVQV